MPFCVQKEMVLAHPSETGSHSKEVSSLVDLFVGAG